MGCGTSSDTGNTANDTSDNVSQIEMVTKFERVSFFFECFATHCENHKMIHLTTKIFQM